MITYAIEHHLELDKIVDSIFHLEQSLLNITGSYLCYFTSL